MFRRSLGPTPDEPRPGLARYQALARVRVLMLLGALVTDAVLFFALKDSEAIEPAFLVAFLSINGPLLAFGLVLAAAGIRWPTFARATWPFAIAIEVFTTFVWIQLTGTVSSYFLFVVPVLITWYRLMVGYAAAMVTLGCALAIHLGAFALERLGVLAQAPLFRDGAGMYADDAFRLGAMVSIDLVFVMTFAFANTIIRVLHEKDQALGAAQRELERAVERASPGRLSGRTLAGRYRLSELLGSGGMGEVYAAIEVANRRAVAVKVLHPHLGSSGDPLERFRREAEIARRVAARRIPAMIDHGITEDGNPFLVMERLKGSDLAAVLRRRERLTFAEVVDLAHQLAEILEAVHAAGVIHRDLKPQNVFLMEATEAATEAIDVRLLDFGIARMIDGAGDRLTESAAVIGSPGYLAPEQVDARIGTVGPHTDLFALGAIAYRALTGCHAFPSRHPAAAIYEAVHLTPTPPSQLDTGLPADVDYVVALALAKRPSDRYARASEFARDLEAALTGTLPEQVRVRARSIGDVGTEHTLTAA